MAESTAVTRRDEIIKLIDTGNYTRQEIADEIGIKVSGVSTQMTYLRWMGYFIQWDEDKKLSFCTEEEFAAWEKEKAANVKTKSTAARTPKEQFDALTKTVGNQEKALKKWEDKLALLEKDIEEGKDVADDAVPEAEAQITLTNIRLARNKAKLAEIDTSDFPEDTEPEDAPDGDDGSADEAEPEDGELL